MALVTSLVGYWSLNEPSSGTRYDVSGNDRDASNNGTVNAGTGKVGNGATNWSNTNYLSVADNAVFECDSTGAFSIAFWYKTGSAFTGNSETLLSKMNAGGTTGWALYSQGNGGALVFQTNGSNNHIATGTFSTSTWYHIVVTRAASGNITFYINGALDTAGQAYTAATANTDTMRFGQRQDTNRPVAGSAVLDEIGFWNKELSSTEVGYLYGSGNGYPFLIAFDSSAEGTANATSLTFSHTCSGLSRILFVGVSSLDNTVTGVTYGGVSMTQIGSTQNPGGNYTLTYYLFAPTAGANNVVITKSSGTQRLRGVSVSYMGALQTALDNTGQGTGGTGLTYSQSITPVAAYCWVTQCSGNNGGTSLLAGSGTTVRQEEISVGWADKNDPVVTPASTTINVEKGSDTPDAWSGTIISFAPIGDPVSGPTTVKTWDGVTQSTGIKTYLGVTVANTKSVIGAT